MLTDSVLLFILDLDASGLQDVTLLLTFRQNII